MFVINSDNSKLTKAIAIVSMIAVGIGLLIQVVSFLAFTKTRIGKRIRKGIIGTAYDFMDESIDQASTRMPAMIKKMESISDSIYQ